MKYYCAYLLKYLDGFLDNFNGFLSTDVATQILGAAAVPDAGVVEGQTIESVCQFVLQFRHILYNKRVSMQELQRNHYKNVHPLTCPHTSLCHI